MWLPAWIKMAGYGYLCGRFKTKSMSGDCFERTYHISDKTMILVDVCLSNKNAIDLYRSVERTIRNGGYSECYDVGKVRYLRIEKIIDLGSIPFRVGGSIYIYPIRELLSFDESTNI